MKRRLGVLLCVIGLSALGLFLYTCGHAPEPVYEGKTLSQWLLWGRDESLPVGAEFYRAQAIEAMGSNAIPFLVAWTKFRMEGWRKLAVRAAPGLSFMRRREQLATAAVEGFRTIGAGARTAIPELTLLMKGNDLEVALRALRSIEAIGEPGVGVLLDAVTNRQAYIRDHAFIPFEGMEHPRELAGSVVRVLLTALDDKDPEVAGAAAAALGAIGPEPGVVKALTNLLNTTDSYVRRRAVRSLGGFGPDSIPVTPCLTHALMDPDRGVRVEATNSLRRLAGVTMGIIKAP